MAETCGKSQTKGSDLGQGLRCAYATWPRKTSKQLLEICGGALSENSRHRLLLSGSSHPHEERKQLRLNEISDISILFIENAKNSI